MTKVLVIDVRTPSHLLHVRKILEIFDFSEFNKIVLFSPKSLGEIELGLLNISYISYQFSPSRYGAIIDMIIFSRKMYYKLGCPSNVEYMTAVNFGPLYDVFSTINPVKKIHLYEDGISSYLDLRVRLRFLKMVYIFILTARFAKIRKNKFFLGEDRLSAFLYTDKPRLIGALGVTAPIRILKSCWHSPVKKETQVYFLSSASVEYGLCSLNKYDELLGDISRFYLGRPVIVSFHHNEKLINEKLNIINKHFFVDRIIDPGVAVEKDMQGLGALIELIAPFNSVALSLIGSGATKKMNLYDDGGPNMLARKQLIKKIVDYGNWEINFHE